MLMEVVSKVELSLELLQAGDW